MDLGTGAGLRIGFVTEASRLNVVLLLVATSRKSDITGLIASKENRRE